MEYLVILVSVATLLFVAVGKDGAVTKGISKILNGSQAAMEAGVKESARAVDIKVDLD